MTTTVTTPVPGQIRIQKVGSKPGQKSFLVTFTWGLMDTTQTSTMDWKALLERRGWMSVPRTWGI